MRPLVHLLSIATVLIPLHVFAQTKPVKQVADSTIMVGQSVTWSADTTYVLNGYVFVDSAATLTIPAGTVVKGKAGSGASASALIIARHGKIYAEGTAANPIIFTAEADTIESTTDLTLTARGLWGGVIILGNARINIPGGTAQVEGIPSTEGKAQYGGTNDADNSGVFRYVSIRHAGAALEANNEINGLTLGGVGSGTTIDHVEVYANLDDGYEWFGGTVNTSYLIAAFCGDDAFDWDQGFRGKGQFWFAIHAADDGGSGGELDGTDGDNGNLPYATPVVYNATIIGVGAANATHSQGVLMNFRAGGGGTFINSIFTDGSDAALQIQAESGTTQNSQVRLAQGDLVLKNNLWYNFGAGTAWTSLITGDAGGTVAAYMTNTLNLNELADPLLGGISRTTNGGLDPRPVKTGAAPAWKNVRLVPQNDGFIQQTDFRGAFGTGNWAHGWTYLSSLGILVNNAGTPDQIPSSVTVVESTPISTSVTTLINSSTHPSLVNAGLTNLSVEIPAGAVTTTKNIIIEAEVVATAVQALDFRIEGEAGSFTFNQPVTIRIPYPASLTNVTAYTIAQYNASNGQWYRIELNGSVQLDSVNKVISANVNHFTVYGIVQSSSIITDGIEDVVNDQTLPTTFSLNQNYPNPFNPVTTVRFALPRTSEVTLTVYDMLGRKVAELVNQRMAPGTYDIPWNASNVASGVYIYRLQTEAFVMTKKMTLLK